MASNPKTYYTPDEYLALERSSETKHEYFNGHETNNLEDMIQLKSVPGSLRLSTSTGGSTFRALDPLARSIAHQSHL